MRSVLAIALLSVSIPALADQQCQYYGNQVVCRDIPGYRDAQVDARIPLANNTGAVNYATPSATYQATAGAAVLIGALVRGADAAYDGIKRAFSGPEQKFQALLEQKSAILIHQVETAMPIGDLAIQSFKVARAKIDNLSMQRYISTEQVMPESLIAEYRDALNQQSDVYMRGFEMHDRASGTYSQENMRQYRANLDMQADQAIRIFSKVEPRDKQTEYQTAILAEIRNRFSR